MKTDRNDPRGVIFDAYKIEGISAPECRSIFLDWALEPRDANQLRLAASALADKFSPEYPEHPMTQILTEAISIQTARPKRRGGRNRN